MFQTVYPVFFLSIFDALFVQPVVAKPAPRTRCVLDHHIQSRLYLNDRVIMILLRGAFFSFTRLDRRLDFFILSFFTFCQRLSKKKPATGTPANPFSRSRRSKLVLLVFLFFLAIFSPLIFASLFKKRSMPIC